MPHTQCKHFAMASAGSVHSVDPCTINSSMTRTMFAAEQTSRHITACRRASVGVGVCVVVGISASATVSVGVSEGAVSPTQQSPE